MRRMADYTRDENIADAGKLAEMLRVIYECPKPTMPACRAMCTPAAWAWWPRATWPWRWIPRAFCPAR